MGMGVPLTLLTVLQALFLPFGCLSRLECFYLVLLYLVLSGLVFFLGDVLFPEEETNWE